MATRYVNKINNYPIYAKRAECDKTGNDIVETYAKKSDLVQSDWNQTTSGELDYIKNKPNEYNLVAGNNISITESNGTVTIDSINFYPMSGNPSGFLTEQQDLSDYATKTYVNEEIGKIGSYVTATLSGGEPDVQNPSTKVIYLTKDESVTGVDQYQEWIYDTTSSWDCIGDTSISLDDYLTKTQTAVSIGSNNTATAPNSFSQGSNNSNTTQSFTQGSNNTAGAYSIAQGYNNDAGSNSLAQGSNNKADTDGFAQGQSNSGFLMSLAQGCGNRAQSGSLAVGDSNTAYSEGVTIGAKNYANIKSFTQGGLNSAMNVSFAQGEVNNAQTRGFAQGTNNTAIMAAAAIGQCNSANHQSVAFGEFNNAGSQSIAVGASNSATSKSLAIGAVTYADDKSLALGGGVSAKLQSFAQGGGNSAYDNSFAQGGGNTATNNSMAQGGGNSAHSGSIAVGGGNSAFNYSQAFGLHSLITDYGMAIGKYNKTSADAYFVIGDGYVDQTQTPFVTVRRDLFVIDKNGNVSSKSGCFYDKNGKVGNYHSASATVTSTGTDFTITLSSNNSYVVLDSSSVSGNQSLNFTIVPPTLEEDELLDCMVQFSPVGGQSTTGHTVSAKGLIQVGLRKYQSINLNYIPNGDIAQVRLLGNTYSLM